MCQECTRLMVLRVEEPGPLGWPLLGAAVEQHALDQQELADRESSGEWAIRSPLED